jgi:hypothetical protein
MLSMPEFDSVDPSMLAEALAVCWREHPNQEMLESCRPGIYLRELDAARWEAYAETPDGSPVSVGVFPKSLVLRGDPANPAVMN